MIAIPIGDFAKMKNKAQENNASSSSTLTSKDPPDIQDRKLIDSKLKESAIEVNKEKRDAQNMRKKLKPLLRMHNEQILEVIRNLEVGKQVPAQFILQVLTRLPKVTILRNRLLIDGEPLEEKASNIVS